VRAYLLGLRQGGRPAARSRPASTGCVSSTATRLTACGGCSGEKRTAAPRQKRLPDALSEDQVRHLLSDIRDPVHKMCLAVMYACGLRISEATTLEISAIDRANRVLRINGKGNKERLVPLPQPVLGELGRLWRTHRTVAGCSPTDMEMRRSTGACRPIPSPRRSPRPASSAR
jgi:integrase